jgi:hypothetical protein
MSYSVLVGLVLAGLIILAVVSSIIWVGIRVYKSVRRVATRKQERMMKWL